MNALPQHCVSCEWGEWGVRTLVAVCDVIVIVDVLSFSTCVEIVTSRGATVYPYPWKDESARTFAAEKNALLAGKRGDRYSLSPGTLLSLPRNARLVLPSPNGATLSLATAGKPTICGCLRNASAVARAAASLGNRIAVIPAGERWPDESLRPAWEDWTGSGAIIEQLPGIRSPEAEAAVAAWQSARSDFSDRLNQCPSGQELILRGYAEDARLAAEHDCSECVPILREEWYARMG